MSQRIVLIALDESEAAETAFKWYLKNVRQENDYVHCITVPEYALGGIKVGPMANPDALMKQFTEQHSKVEKMCANYTAELRSNNAKGQVDAISGNKPADTIIDHASSIKADMIVMGTRNLTGIKRMMLGSVSQAVLNHAGIPVVIVPAARS